MRATTIMANTRHYLFHGDPCLRCPDRRPGQQPRAAAIHGCCLPCWLGSTEADRDDALLEELLTPVDTPAMVALAQADAERDAAFEAWGLL